MSQGASLPSNPARQGEAAADRRVDIDVEALLIWTYRAQRADVVIERGVGLQSIEAAADGVFRPMVSADGCARMASIGLLGTVVDGGGFAAGDLHPDAETVHGVVRRLGGRGLGQVIAHARAGDRPDWMPSPRPRLLGVRGRVSSRPLLRFEDWDRNRDYGYCPLIQLDGPDDVKRARDGYRLWHGNLVRVFVALRGLRFPLQSHRVGYPSAPSVPWTSGGVQ